MLLHWNELNEHGATQLSINAIANIKLLKSLQTNCNMHLLNIKFIIFGQFNFYEKWIYFMIFLNLDIQEPKNNYRECWWISNSSLPSFAHRHFRWWRGNDKDLWLECWCRNWNWYWYPLLDDYHLARRCWRRRLSDHNCLSRWWWRGWLLDDNHLGLLSRTINHDHFFWRLGTWNVDVFDLGHYNHLGHARCGRLLQKKDLLGPRGRRPTPTRSDWFDRQYEQNYDCVYGFRIHSKISEKFDWCMKSAVRFGRESLG